MAGFLVTLVSFPSCSLRTSPRSLQNLLLRQDMISPAEHQLSQCVGMLTVAISAWKNLGQLSYDSDRSKDLPSVGLA